MCHSSMASRNMVGKCVGAIQNPEGLQIKIRTSGLQDKVPEYITKAANIHIQTLKRWQEEFAEVIPRKARELDENHDEANKATFAADSLAYSMQTMIGIAASMA